MGVGVGVSVSWHELLALLIGAGLEQEWLGMGKDGKARF